MDLGTVQNAIMHTESLACSTVLHSCNVVTPTQPGLGSATNINQPLSGGNPERTQKHTNTRLQHINRSAPPLRSHVDRSTPILRLQLRQRMLQDHEGAPQGRLGGLEHHLRPLRQGGRSFWGTHGGSPPFGFEFMQVIEEGSCI